mmetsp:Transcript_30762/g.53177  ORF Transcript_30762/g.53177 Transcript_30762/m.53177 type:complete len:221 (-) Transcript_30762:63-725(-)
MLRTPGLFCFKNCDTPVIVPPVPTPPIKMSTAPSVWSQISGPVVSRCTLGLSGLLNCCRMTAFSPISLAICSALATQPAIPFAAGVRTRRAPKAFRMTLRSKDIVSGIVSTTLYPFAAPTIASPMPVFPEVGSTREVLPGAISPRFSASSIIDRAIRSLTLLQGSMLSSFTKTVATQPSLTRLSRTKGVLPMAWVISAQTLGCGGADCEEVDPMTVPMLF